MASLNQGFTVLLAGQIKTTLTSTKHEVVDPGYSKQPALVELSNSVGLIIWQGVQS